MKDFLTLVFQDYFKHAVVVVHEDTYAAVYATNSQRRKSHCLYLRNGFKLFLF